MGYLANHLATVVCAIFAAVLTGLWFVMVPEFPVLEFIFIMAVPIMWFLTAMCWLAQKSVDYVHAHPAAKTSESAVQVLTSDGKPASGNKTSPDKKAKRQPGPALGHHKAK